MGIGVDEDCHFFDGLLEDIDCLFRQGNFAQRSSLISLIRVLPY